VTPILSSSEYPPVVEEGRPAAAALSRSSYTLASGTMIVPPPFVISYCTPSVRSCSTMVFASVPLRPENSGVYAGFVIQKLSATTPRARTATPMIATVRCAMVNSRMVWARRRSAVLTWVGIRTASS